MIVVCCARCGLALTGFRQDQGWSMDHVWRQVDAVWCASCRPDESAVFAREHAAEFVWKPETTAAAMTICQVLKPDAPEELFWKLIENYHLSGMAPDQLAYLLLSVTRLHTSGAQEAESVQERLIASGILDRPSERQPEPRWRWKKR